MARFVVHSVSFISFAVILLIFIFVFREALPIFSSTEKSVSSEYLQSETYGDEPGDESDSELSDETVLLETGGAEGRAGLRNLLSREWQPVSGQPKYGLIPLFVGSLKVTFIALLIAAPLSILAALYTAVFASAKLRELIKPTIELLAGFPSVVIGFFALITLASFFQNLFGYTYRLNAFIGGLALSLAVIPIIFTITEEALSSVPREMTEASLALGATRWQTALFVILPAATPGVFAALILGFGRAFGETMIVLMATGNAALTSFNFLEPVRTLSATIGAEMAEVVFGDTHYNVLFLIGSLLFIITFALNAVAEFYIRGRLLKRFRGED
ncbi:MAG: phosphate ABC transporter permease subunit PstC [Calditrichaeota bacterium]|nr:MAG: phosphate ABC transporter permease subunit PstC [Calditrichota bacterium]